MSNDQNIPVPPVPPPAPPMDIPTPGADGFPLQPK